MPRPMKSERGRFLSGCAISPATYTLAFHPRYEKMTGESATPNDESDAVPADSSGFSAVRPAPRIGPSATSATSAAILRYAVDVLRAAPARVAYAFTAVVIQTTAIETIVIDAGESFTKAESESQ